MKQKFHLFICILILLPILIACPRNEQKKAAREIYQNNMDLNFKDCYNITFNSLQFDLPKKFNNIDYIDVCSNGKECKTYGIDELNLYFGISEIKANELSNIHYLTKINNSLEAIQYDAVGKRTKSIGSNTKVSEVVKFKHKLPIIYQSVIEPFVKRYTFESDYSSIYFVATIQKNNQFFVIQFCGKADKMNYFLDDFETILSSIK